MTCHPVRCVIAMLGNYLDQNTSSGGPNGWIGPDIVDSLTLISLAVGAFAKPKWLQWLAALTMLGFVAFFLLSYATAA